MDDLKNRITRLREDFMMSSLSEKEVNINPFLQFQAWLNEAMKAEIPEWQAMTLSTVSREHRPSSRIVYLRQFENNKYWFYGNYESKKGKQLKENPQAALSFFWPQLQRQIRIEGQVELCLDITSEEYFNSRPYDSQLGAWASAQSSVLKNREELESRFEKFKIEFDGKVVHRPPFWGGWILSADYYEFWQGRQNRLHDRIAYQRMESKWQIQRLSP